MRLCKNTLVKALYLKLNLNIDIDIKLVYYNDNLSLNLAKDVAY